MKDQDLQVLEKIIELQGDCLKADLCRSCPFRKKCLPEFLKIVSHRPSKKERFNLALDAVTNTALFDDSDISYSRD